MTLTYNGVTLTKSNGYLVNRTEGFASPAVRTSEENTTNRDGGNIYSKHWGMRTMIIEGRIVGTSAEDYFTKRRALINAFNLERGTLTVTNWAGTQYSLVSDVTQSPTLIEQGGEVTFGDFRVQLKAENPFFLGTQTSYSATLATGGGFPLSAPVSTPLGSQSGNRFIIDNDGGADSYASFTITSTGNIVSPTITNLADSKSFTIDTTISTGDYVQVYRNSNRLNVLKNGVTDWFGFFVGEFPEIKQGNNTIVFTASSGDGTLSATFSNPYLTI